MTDFSMYAYTVAIFITITVSSVCYITLSVYTVYQNLEPGN